MSYFCQNCRQLVLYSPHKCPPEWHCWVGDGCGDIDPEDLHITVFAFDDEMAAEKAVEEYESTSCEYSDDGDVRKVLVRAAGAGMGRVFSVDVCREIKYYAQCNPEPEEEADDPAQEA